MYIDVLYGRLKRGCAAVLVSKQFKEQRLPNLSSAQLLQKIVIY